MPTVRRARSWAIALILLAMSTASVAIAESPARPAMRTQDEMAFQPCLAGADDCTAPAATTSDGRVLVQIIPFYSGHIFVIIEGDGYQRRVVFECDGAVDLTSCSRTIDTKRPGTYEISVMFTPASRGGLLLEVVTPS